MLTPAAALSAPGFALLALGISLLVVAALIVRVNRLLLPAVLALAGIAAIGAWEAERRRSATAPPPGIRIAEGAADLPSTVREEPAAERPTLLLSDLQPVRTLSWPGDQIYAVALDPGGRWAAVGTGRLVLVDLDSGAQGASLPTDRQGGERVRSLAFSPDGRRLAAGFSGRIEYLAVPTLERVYELRFRSPLGGRTEVADLAVSPSGHVLAATAGTEVVFHDLRSGGAIGSLRPDERGIDGLAWSGDGRLLATVGSGRRSLAVWRTDELAGLGERRALCRLELAPDRWVDAAGFGRGGGTLVALVASEREGTRLVTWNLTGCRIELDHLVGNRRTLSLASSPDGEAAVVLGPGDVAHTIGLSDGETTGSLRMPKGGSGVLWSGDGERLLLISFASDEVAVFERR